MSEAGAAHLPVLSPHLTFGWMLTAWPILQAGHADDPGSDNDASSSQGVHAGAGDDAPVGSGNVGVIGDVLNAAGVRSVDVDAVL